MTDAADASVDEAYARLGTEREALQSAAFDMVIAERMASQPAIRQSETTLTASDD